MGVYHPYPVRCQCGTTFTANLAEGVNAVRSPRARASILAGTFHRLTCPTCGSTFTAEKEFVYTDFERGTMIKVKPRHDRHLWRDASRSLVREANRVPDSFVPADVRHLRVVFGMAELREKLLAQDAGIDDRAIELLKVLAIADHPVLVDRPRLRLSLNAVSNDGIEFIAAYDHDERNYRITFPRWLAEHVLSQRETLTEWAGAHRQSILAPVQLAKDAEQAPDRYWVNIWRWSPQPMALDRLRTYAAAIRDGKPVDLASKDFGDMLAALPHGAHLPSWAKQDTRTVFEYAKQQGNGMVQDALFEIRFGKNLEDDWALNAETEDIDTLWQLLANLPALNVEGNTYFDEIFLAENEDAGWYQPKSLDIYIGALELPNRERFEDIMRHEVGHAVHEQFVNDVDKWLLQEFGWQMFEAKQPDVDAWVGLMGGWGHTTLVQRAEIAGYLDTALGPGEKWAPGMAPNAPNGHPWWGASFGARLAYERTGSYWYNHTDNWYRHNGRAFFLNYYYRALCVVNESALELIKKMPSMYAAMSPFEFFAELYALYYDLDDPQRVVIPAKVMTWLDENITTRPAAPAAMPAPRAAKEWDTTTRPGGNR